MKYLAIAAVALGMVYSQASAQCVPIYDTTGAPLINFYGGAGSERMGDDYTPIAPPPGFNWSICDIQFIMVDMVPGPCNATVNLYDTVNPRPLPVLPAFANLRASLTVPVNTMNPPPPPAAYLVTITGPGGAPLGICLPNPPGNLGFGAEFVFDCPGQKTVGVGDFFPTVGTGTNGFYVDFPVNGSLQTNKFYTFGAAAQQWNVMFRITAQPAVCLPLLGALPNGNEPEVKIEPLPNMPVTQMKSLLRPSSGNGGNVPPKSK